MLTFLYVSVDGTIRLYTSRAELPIPTQMQGIRVSVLGHNLKIQLETVGLTVLWDLNRLIVVEATAGLFNRTAGLCGTIDQRPENDFVSKNGVLHKVELLSTSMFGFRTFNYV